MIEAVVLIILGILLVYLGKYYLNSYKEDFENGPRLTVTWDTVVQLLSSGTSNGRNAINCFIGGGLFLILGTLMLLIPFIASLNGW